MDSLVASVSHHPYSVIFLIVFAESAGLPAPAAVALVAGGAAASAHAVSVPLGFVVAVVALLLGDLFLFLLGRYTGWGLLSFLCSLSMNPETCILRSAESFYRRGRVTLIFAKFIPGVNTMAPPLAGSMKMKFRQFLLLDFLGACIYVLAYGALGYVFRDFVARITRGLQSAGHVMVEVIITAVAGYAVYRVIQYRRHKLGGAVPRVDVADLAQRMMSAEGKDIILADVRSHGYYNAGAARIAGSIRLEPNRLQDELKSLPRDKDIYLYCT